MARNRRVFGIDSSERDKRKEKRMSEHNGVNVIERVEASTTSPMALGGKPVFQFNSRGT